MVPARNCSDLFLCAGPIYELLSVFTFPVSSCSYRLCQAIYELLRVFTFFVTICS